MSSGVKMLRPDLALGANANAGSDGRSGLVGLTMWWDKLDLSRRFMVTTSLALILGMVLVGRWVSGRISEGVVHSHATAAALYTDSFVEPLVQELASGDDIGASGRQALDELLLPRAVGEPIVGFRIWKGDRVVYSNDRSLIGQSFPPSSLRAEAWSGKVVAEYEHHEPGHEPTSAKGGAILEIYAPVRRSGSNHIIALAETYQLAPGLPEELERASIGSWLVVSAFTTGMLLLQFVVVHNGNRTIERQRQALNDRIAELSGLLAENHVLSQRAQEAHRRVAEMNEQFLRGIGSDLHDGPLQLVAMSVLRLGSLRQTVSAAAPTIVEEAMQDLDVLRSALQDCLLEIRNISAGLALPEIENLDLAEVVRAAVARHERRTLCSVALETDEFPGALPLSIRSCAYRVVQEGLMNAFRHAGGKFQMVRARFTGAAVEISVCDNGPGPAIAEHLGIQFGQGLSGLRDRVEALGGTLELTSRPEGGASLLARLPITPQGSRTEPANG